MGLSTLKALKTLTPQKIPALKIHHTTLEIPRANLEKDITALQTEQTNLLSSLLGTSLNFKTFLPLIIKYNLAPDFPAYTAHRYLHEKKLGRENLIKLDAENRQNLDRYLSNIYTMEALTRLQTNLNLLKKRHAQNQAANTPTIETEVVGLRIGTFILITFPGELSVQIGLDIKQKSPHSYTFVAGVTNGYIYYTPTAEQLKNRGKAQEDSDCLVAPEWHQMFENKVLEILNKL